MGSSTRWLGFGIMLLLIVGVVLIALTNGYAGERKYKQRFLMVKVTAYCPCSICTKGLGITATGRDAGLDGIAVDPDIIPLGAYIDVHNYGNWKKADDTGSLVKGHHIDIRFQTHEEAVNWGTKIQRIRVWEAE